jgi:signal transduction histidine kinase
MADIVSPTGAEEILPDTIPYPPARSRPGMLARFSLEQKVPLVAAALIVMVAAAISIAAYLEVRHIARQAAYAHINDVVKLVTTGQRTGDQIITTVHAIATRPAIAAYVESPTSEHRTAALTAMLTPVGPSAGNIIGTELMDESGHLLLTTNPVTAAAPSDFPAVIGATDSASLGKLRTLGEDIVIPVSVRLPGSSRAYVVQWRRATTSSTASRQTRRLIGAGTTLLYGNRDGSFWTDLEKVVPAPPADMRHSRDPVEYTRVPSQGRVVAGIVPLAGTPWAFAVEFPLRQVMAPADKFLRGIIAITLICTALGLIAAWWFARRLTTPLRKLTDAAHTIAGGGHASEPVIARADELGDLATSFAVMSRQVEESRQRLEERVVQRTGELNAALQQLRDTQETLVRREKLATLGQLAGGVAHELRNPLGVMSNGIFYLETVLASSPANVRDYLGMLREQVALSTKIIDDLLGFARISPADRRPVQLADLVGRQLARMPNDDRIRIETGFPAGLPAVEVDPVHIGQVVLNLVTNAAQAMGDAGGVVRISAETSGTDDVALRVSDNGPGIPAELHERIFEPLFTTKSRGIGLGLSVSRALVHANGGDISVLSEPGQGATFILTVPVAGAPA